MWPTSMRSSTRRAERPPFVIDRAGLQAHLEAAAAELEGVTIAQDGDGAVTWSADGTAFAHLTKAGVDLRLDPPIADAATRTPDAASSPRGPAWIRFHPRVLDPHAIDRLDAWVALARRRAAPERKGTE
jgi:hypothetical protein